MSTAGKLVEHAMVARRERRLSEAHRDLTEAVALERRDSSYLGLARALTALGQIERDLGNGSLARDLYAEAVELYRGAGDVLGEQDEARLLTGEALNLYADTGVSAGVAECFPPTGGTWLLETPLA